MKTSAALFASALLGMVGGGIPAARGEAILTSWYTNRSTVLARVVQTTSSSSGTRNVTPVTTWPSVTPNNNTGGLAQTNPVYADVQRIRYDSTNVYINSSGLASYTMGPWLSANGGLFGFWPVSQKFTVKIPRTPALVSTNKTRHQGGVIGLMVNGVAIYDLGDAFAFVQTTNSPTVTGSDIMGFTETVHPWWRDALAVEVVTFDPGFAHQPGINGQYHYHAEPKALRFQLGDNMQATYDPANNTHSYAEDTSNLHHSPIIGWCFDGFPIYGPYGYANPTNPASAVTRMRSAFVLRNASNHVAYGTTDLAVTGRKTLPKWAAIAEGFTYVANSNSDFDLGVGAYGPDTTYSSSGPGGVTTYSLGRYVGDYDYLGDRGQTQGPGGAFDLDQYNGRQCVTPEFPGGTYAYFVSNDAAGKPAFPYMLGKQYNGIKSGATGATVSVGATEIFNGGPNTRETMKAPWVNPTNGTVTLTWSSVEGGTYVLQAAGDPGTNSWSAVATVLAATNITQTVTNESGVALGNPKRVYRVQRTVLAPYDP